MTALLALLPSLAGALPEIYKLGTEAVDYAKGLVDKIQGKFQAQPELITPEVKAHLDAIEARMLELDGRIANSEEIA